MTRDEIMEGFMIQHLHKWGDFRLCFVPELNLLLALLVENRSGLAAYNLEVRLQREIKQYFGVTLQMHTIRYRYLNYIEFYKADME
jgi:hypothetical protein